MNRRHGFWQSVKGDADIEVMNMMIADVSGKPLHQLVESHVAGRLKRGSEVGPRLG